MDHDCNCSECKPRTEKKECSNRERLRSKQFDFLLDPRCEEEEESRLETFKAQQIREKFGFTPEVQLDYPGETNFDEIPDIRANMEESDLSNFDPSLLLSAGIITADFSPIVLKASKELIDIISAASKAQSEMLISYKGDQVRMLEAYYNIIKRHSLEIESCVKKLESTLEIENYRNNTKVKF